MTPFEVALGEIGVKEVCGDGDCAKIVEYHSCTTLHANDDEVPWCSAFVNWCFQQCGLAGTKLANARSWLDFGEDIKAPTKGCLVVLRRGTNPQSGHVGFFVEQKNDVIKVLGGNQSDQVKYSWYETKDVLAYRGW
jgi:uncharacterized protein (TIGR02594 family)